MSRAEHFATLGEMATGLAHEIRNPLAGIAGVIEIIGRDLPSTSPARAVVKDVRQEIARINHIVTDLLQTARPHPPKVRKSDLNTTVEHAVMLGRQQALAKSIEISLQKDPSLPEVEHDSDQIHQVMLNLLLNALQAIDVQRQDRVNVKRKGTTAVIEVADNGRGIPPENLPNIFRPFYTTKGDGTGLGSPWPAASSKTTKAESTSPAQSARERRLPWFCHCRGLRRSPLRLRRFPPNAR